MKKIGFIPLRKGSKGIKNKNTKKMVGRPLYMWVLSEAIFSKLDEVYVYTDDIELIEFINKEYTWSSKVKAVLRSKESASDTASTEIAMLEFSKLINHKYEILCLLQATSPFTTRIDINNCLNKIVNNKYESVLTVVKTCRFIWDSKQNPLNYDIHNRPRRQDFEGLLIENGAVYATTKEAFLKSKNRISDKIGTIEMPEESLHEIDTQVDWIVVEQLLINRQKQQKETQKITHLVLDVDGVFTNGTITYTKDGEHTKQFDMRDGMGLEILREQGVEVMIMTSEQSEIVVQRMKKLNIENVYLGVKDKYSKLIAVLKEKSLSMNNIAYVGDDVNDLANICSVGWSLTPNNATQIVKQHADIILSNNAGEGAIREACKFLLNYNKRFSK